MSDNSPEPSKNPYAAPTKSSLNNDGRQPTQGQPGRGFVRQIPILGVMTIVQGVLLLVMGVLCFGYGIFFVMMPGMMPPEELARMKAANPVSLETIGAVAIGIGVLVLVVAIMHIVAGIRTLKYRGRVFTIVTWLVGLLAAFTCYCGPTSIGLAIWGLIVFLNPAVVSAFKMAETGMKSREIEDQFY